MIKIFFTGNLTADPRIGEHNGKQVANASVAAHTPFRDANGEYITNFVDISTWAQVDMLSKMRKGNKIGVTGSMCVKTYKKNDGSTGVNIVCKADTIENLTPRSNNSDDIFDN